MGDISFPATYGASQTSIAIGANSTVNVGLIAGALNATKDKDGEKTIENARVGGNILFGNATIQGTINAGALVGTFNGGTISSSYAWGNVELKNATLLKDNSTSGNSASGNSTPDNEFNIKSLTVGGLVGNVNGATKIADNYSLTSMYITRLASLGATNINALVGTKSSSVEATKDKDGKETNFYCHQINLATDTIGQNLYYQSGKVAEHDPILKKLEKLGLAKNQSEGSKLNPIDYYGGATEKTEKDKYYYLSSSSINESKDLEGHLVGDGKTLRSNNLTPFREISKTGVVSGIGFVVTSKTEGTNAGRVNSSGNNTTLPSGVAYENKGIIFAVNVYAKGFKGLNSSFGNVLYSFNAGIAGTNTGLISDSGVVFNVKSLFAGISSNNTGVVANSYATGAVHEKAQYALTAGSNAGTIRNSYSAIDAKTNVAQNNKPENVYYDETTIHTESTKVGIGKDTNSLSTVNTEKTNILKDKIKDKNNNEINNTERLTGNNNWKQDFRINFGYPYLGNNAYSGFSYMEEYTGGGSHYVSVLPEEISDSQEYQPKLDYVKEHNSWKLYRIYLGDKVVSHGVYNYIWINNGKYKFVITQLELPVWPTYSGDPIISYSILISGKEVTIDLKIDTKKVSIEVYGVKITDDPCVQIPNAGKLAQLQGESDTNSNAHNESLWGKKYILLSNIDLSAAGLESWSPIGTGSNNGTKQAFTGCFDGNKYKIIEIPGMSVENTHLGFFGYVSGGTIQNCGFIYRNEARIIQNGNNDAGGVVGQLDGNATVDNVSSSGATIDIKTTTNSFGGLVGAAVGSSSITNSTNFNTVTTKVSPANNAGGIVGYLNVSGGSVKNCNNYGKIENTSRAGGIVGQLVSASEVSNCSNYNVITATKSVSGIANVNAKNLTGEESSGEIKRDGKDSGHEFSYNKITFRTTEWPDVKHILKFEVKYNGVKIGEGKATQTSDVKKTYEFTYNIPLGKINISLEVWEPGYGKSCKVKISYNIANGQPEVQISGSKDFGYEIISDLSQVNENFSYITKSGEQIGLTRKSDSLDLQKGTTITSIPYKPGAATSYFGPTMILPGGNICRIYDLDPKDSQSLWSNSTSKVTPTDGVYNIYTAKEFAWVAQQIKAGKMTGETINICNDIDLTGKVWDPIKNYKKDFKFAGLNILVNDNNHESIVLHYKGIEITISYIKKIDAKKHLLGIKVGKNKICEFVYSPGPGKTYFSETFDNVKYHLVSDTYSGGITMLIIQPIYNNEFYFNGYKIFGLSKGAYDYNTTNPIFTKDSDYVPSENVTVYSHTGGASSTIEGDVAYFDVMPDTINSATQIGENGYYYAFCWELLEFSLQWILFKSSDNNIVKSNWNGDDFATMGGTIGLTDNWQSIWYDNEFDIIFYAKKGACKYAKLITHN